jgi:molybdenum cofactor cytidylyltransferase
MQTFAVIPAAGRSLRMGQPKLLLPWGESTVLEHVLATWCASRVDRVVLVVHPQDRQIVALGAAAGAHVVQPSVAPSEMKISVQLALEYISHFAPQSTDAWLLAPADMPGLAASTIDTLVGAYESSLVADPNAAPRIWAPRCGGRRGHPVLFPWALATEVGELGSNEGINALLTRHEVAYVEASADAILEDLDTPEDYERLRARHGQ